MIHANLFFPERIGSYFLTSCSYTAIAINKRSISATVIRAIGRQRTIEQVIEQPIDQTQTIPLNERISAALRELFEKVPAKSTIIDVITSNACIGKVITVPLMSPEKIKLVVPFEIESALPFSLAEAAVDSIITATNSTEKTASVFVVATPKSLIEEHTLLFAEAGRRADRITTQVAALYNIITQLPALKQRQQALLIIDIEHQTTTVMLCLRAQILAVRLINRPLQDLHEQGASEQFLNEIKVTAASFMKQYNQAATIMLCGPGATESGISQLMEKTLEQPCEIFTINSLIMAGGIKSNAALTQKQFLTVAAALPDGGADDFNLDQQIAEQQQATVILRQTIATLSLALILLGILIATRILVVRNLRSEIAASEKETIGVLRSRLNLTAPKGTSLDSINKLARADIANKEKIWSSLSTQSRFVMLKVLDELSKRLNRQELGLNLQKIVISADTESLLLEGTVKDFEALKKLEEQLRQAPLFKNIPHLQETTFSAKITLNIAGETGS